MAWTREEIADHAGFLLGVVTLGQPASAQTRDLLMRVLESLLRSLPWWGLNHARLTNAQVDLTVLANTNSIALPGAFYDNPVLRMVDPETSVLGPIDLIGWSEWNQISEPDKTALLPTKAYIDKKAGLLRVWPEPTQAVVFKLAYGAAMTDPVSMTPHGLGPEWDLGLAEGIAAHVAPGYGKTSEFMDRMEKRWTTVRELGIRNQRDLKPVRVTYED